MDCCAPDEPAVTQDRRRVLIQVLLINAGLFCVEITAGLMARSTALLGDSLDMLGDVLVYGFSLYVLTRSERARAKAAALKGLIMLCFGGLVLIEVGAKLVHPVMPAAATMGLVAALALVGNAICFALLARHRGSDLNMRSTWLCSRNDLIANSSVIVAAVFVAWTGTQWPDVAVGLGIAALFFQTAIGVLRDALAQLRRPRARQDGSDSLALLAATGENLRSEQDDRNGGNCGGNTTASKHSPAGKSAA